MKRFPFFKKKVEECHRRIRANDPESNALKNYATNRISTTKYNLITFLPKNLFDQFRQLANFYFLVLVGLQFIPQISSLAPIYTILPLVLVLTLAAIKDARDDFARHRSDKAVNNRQVKIIVENELLTKTWKDIKVADMVLLTNNEFVTADVVLISTSEPNGLCYIETAELDGETNLKARQALEETIDVGDDIDQLSAFNAEIEYESPNNQLGRFEGNLIWQNKTFPLKNDNVLLRGTRLRNTQWAVGIVCYAGPDTKLMKNSGKAPFKRTKTDYLLDRIILGVLVFLLLMCALMTICCGIWESSVGFHFRVYLPWESYVSTDRRLGALKTSLLVFFSYIIILSTVVPISLYVNIEFIRLIQSKWIEWDVKMFCEEENLHAQAKTTTLNEELGQIEYIFSDKTGTLTQNIMTFKKCSIRGKLFGYVTDDNQTEIEDLEKLKPIEFEEEEEEFVWYDQKLVDAINGGDEDVNNFFTLLALCHTVMSEKIDGKVVYQAQSPDENALVSAARTFGFVFDSRTQSSITIRIGDHEETFDLLHILDFNNDRKRMSIIVKKAEKYYLYCKGADSKIKERLFESEKEMMMKTDEHLNKFANAGLRTLCLAWKELDEREYQQWAAKLAEANTSMEKREEKVNDVYEEIEKDLRLLGATAIEDKLQDGVAECIDRLRRAGIKIWVLTGDKVETAYNIGLSCRLLTNGMEIQMIEEESEAEVLSKLEQIRNVMIDKIESLFDVTIDDRDKKLDWKDWGVDVMKFDQHRRTSPSNNRSTTITPDPHESEEFEGFALLITGQSLVHALSDKLKMKFLELGTMCKTVLCCRVTPLQKGEVVKLVKENEKKITLAIGDGANDVSMIQRAHIGVGISGKEGRQAVSASDFSFGQFRFLERLLLVHGRWSYLRISKFLRFFFYKNFVFTLCQFWFGFFSAFSAQSLYDPLFAALYNTLFSTLTVLAMSVFDQDVNAESSLRKPHLYMAGQKNEFFNKKMLIVRVIHGSVTACVVFFVPYLSLSNNIGSGRMMESDLQSFGFLIATIMVIVVNLQNGLETWYWTIWYHLALAITIIGYFFFHWAIYSTIIRRIFKENYSYVGVIDAVLSTGTFWLTLLLTCVILLLPVFCYEFYRMRFMPSETDKARLNQKYRTEEKAAFLTHVQRKLRPSKPLIRSTYAFAQEEGWGHLITSGRMQINPTTRPRVSLDFNLFPLTSIGRNSSFATRSLDRIPIDRRFRSSIKQQKPININVDARQNSAQTRNSAAKETDPLLHRAGGDT